MLCANTLFASISKVASLKSAKVAPLMMTRRSPRTLFVSVARASLCLLPVLLAACAAENTATPGDEADSGSTEDNGSDGSVGAGGGSLIGSGGTDPGGEPPTPGGPGCSGNEIFCEDFEGHTVGQAPGTPWSQRDESCQHGPFAIGVTDSKAHQGSKSLQVTNKSWAQCRIAAAIGEQDEFWLRSFVYLSPELDMDNRETLEMDLTPSSGLGQDSKAVRFGYRSKEPCTTSAGPQVTIIGLGGGEQTGCSTTAQYPKGEWYCFEAHVQQAGKLVVKTFVNGAELSYTSQGKPTTTEVSSSTNLEAEDKVNHLRLGLFSTGDAEGEVYLDDIAVSKTRIGCGN